MRWKPAFHCRTGSFSFFLPMERSADCVSRYGRTRPEQVCSSFSNENPAVSGKIRSSRRHRKSRLGVVIGIGALTTCVGVYAVWLQGHQNHGTPDTVGQSSATSSIADRPDQSQTTVVLSTPNNNDCRRYELNLATGTRNERGPSNCADDGKQPGRLETISKSFRNR